MLDDDQVERYARQIVVPGIGAAGQEKLLRSSVLVVGHPRGCATAALYLRAAGVCVLQETRAAAVDADLIVVCDPSSLEPDRRDEIASSGRRVVWYGAHPDGFLTGVHPDQPVPARDRDGLALCLHDVAACDAAALACGYLSGILSDVGATVFEVC